MQKCKNIIIYMSHLSSLIFFVLSLNGGWDSAVGITIRYGLGGPGIESRWGGARFSASFQTCPGAHPASYTVGTGSFPGGKAAEAWH